MKLYPGIPDDDLRDLVHEWLSRWVESKTTRKDYLRYVSVKLIADWFCKSDYFKDVIRKDYFNTLATESLHTTVERVILFINEKKFDMHIAGEHHL